MKTLQGYILRELVPPVAVSTGFFTLCLLVAKIFSYLEMLLEAGASPGVFFHFMGLLVGTIAALTIPMAVLLGTLIGISRLTTENEILAMRAGGVSLRWVFWPLVAGALLLSAALAGVNCYVVPALIRQISSMKQDIIFQAATSLAPRKFRDLEAPDLAVSIYFEDGDTTSTAAGRRAVAMNRVNLRLVTRLGAAGFGDAPKADAEEKDETQDAAEGEKTKGDRKGPRRQVRIFARRGVLEGNPETREVTFRLQDGTVMEIDPDAENEGESRLIRFKKFTRSFRLGGDDEREGDLNPREMDATMLFEALNSPPEVSLTRKKTGEIRHVWKEHFNLRNDLFRRLTLPVSTVAFVLIAVPLGIEWRPRAKSLSFIIALILMGIYYMILTWASAFGATGVSDQAAFAALMLPNVLIGGVGAYRLWRMDRI